MRFRTLVISLVILSAAQGRLCAGSLSAGLYNSFRGFGISLDYAANDDIMNSYTIYADTYKLFPGVYRNAGIKMVYLHYNRLASFDCEYSSFDVLFGPGASTGYVRDRGSDLFGYIFTADIAFALRAKFRRDIEIEFGTVAELGMVTGENGGKLQLSMYDNGLRQALLPFIKIMVKFR